MGNRCCPAANPCDTVEERSGLLQQDVSKPAVHTAETGVVGAFQDSPEAEVDVRKTSDEITEEEKVVTDQVKLSPQAREIKPAKTQENGPMQEEHKQTEAPSPGKGAGLKADSNIIAQEKNVEDTTTDNGPFEGLQCTLESPQAECATTDPQVSTEVNVSSETKEVVVEELSAAAKDKIPDGVSQESDEVPPKNLTIGAEIPTEHITPEKVCDDDDKDEDNSSKAAVSNALDRPSEDSSLCNEVSSPPDSQLPAEACRGSSSVSGHETSTLTGTAPQPPSASSVSPSSTVIKELDSENGSPEDLVKSHDTLEPSPGLDSPQRQHNGVEQGVWEPSSASKSQNTGKHSKAGLQWPPIGSSEVASLENLAQDIEGKTELRAAGEDEDVPKAKEEEEEEEMEVASSEATTEAETEGETLELNDRDKLVAGTSAVVEVVVLPVSEQEQLAEEDIGHSLNSGEHSKAGLQWPPIGSSEVASLENLAQDIEGKTELRAAGEDEDVPKAKEEEEEEEMEVASSEATTEAETEGETLELNDRDKLVAGTSAVVEVVVLPVSEQEQLAEEDIGHSDEDLYRGAEELAPKQVVKAGPAPLFEITLPKVEDRCSLAPAVDVLSYSEREWKGNTAKSILIRKGYEEMSQRFGSLRRVRGDNYCALRATLFQLLSRGTRLPAWLQQEDLAMLPKELEAREGLISQWTFPGECQQGDGAEDATQQLKRYMERLRNRWQAAVDCSGDEERRRLCEQVFQGGEEELGLLEALKLLMLGRAVELHASMQAGGDVPVFCWLLFARDSSECPRSFLSNHLSRVGFSGGLEQVEMFLLGYALRCTIQVYRLYMADTEEFITYYPDDHKEDWPSVCLVTEDDRHYNVPVGEAAELPEGETSS